MLLLINKQFLCTDSKNKQFGHGLFASLLLQAEFVVKLKLGKCKVFNDTQKNERKVRHCLHQALKITRQGVRELEGKNLLLNPWFVLVHGTAHTMLGNH